MALLRLGCLLAAEDETLDAELILLLAEGVDALQSAVDGVPGELELGLAGGVEAGGLSVGQVLEVVREVFVVAWGGEVFGFEFLEEGLGVGEVDEGEVVGLH